MTKVQNAKPRENRDKHSLLVCASLVIRDAYHKYRAWRVVKRHIALERHRYDDRRVLEQIIIPFLLSRLAPRTVLEIGREPYQAFYNEFFAGRELWTVDRDANKAPFGARNHIVDDAANLRRHFPEGYFDLVLMNGVLGWGLNEREAIEQAFDAVHALLAPGGVFVLGWNDTPDLVPVPLNQMQALKLFDPYFFPPLNGTSFKCSTCEHTYSFFVKQPLIRRIEIASSRRSSQ
jgi:SAM-dependent methyltransferase